MEGIVRTLTFGWKEMGSEVLKKFLLPFGGKSQLGRHERNRDLLLARGGQSDHVLDIF